MAVVELSIHQTSRVSVGTQTVNLDNGDGYTVHTVIVHYTDFDNQAQELCLTLYGLQSKGGMSVPFEFVKDEADEPPPALKLAMERDLDGAVRHGKVFGEFLDSMLSPKRS